LENLKEEFNDVFNLVIKNLINTKKLFKILILFK